MSLDLDAPSAAKDCRRAERFRRPFSPGDRRTTSFPRSLATPFEGRAPMVSNRAGRTRRPTLRGPSIERLEGRTLLAVDFRSVVGIPTTANSGAEAVTTDG